MDSEIRTHPFTDFTGNTRLQMGNGDRALNIGRENTSWTKRGTDSAPLAPLLVDDYCRNVLFWHMRPEPPLKHGLGEYASVNAHG